jgi:hypothetical protein
MLWELDKKNDAHNSRLAPALHSYFETTIQLNHNNSNFGTAIYLESRAVRQAAKRSTEWHMKTNE